MKRLALLALSCVAFAPVAAQRADSVRVQTWLGGAMTSQTFTLGAVIPPVIVPPVVGYVLPAKPDTFTVPSPGRIRVVQVPAGADLQLALNAAIPGDELVLSDTAVWTGNFVLPKQNAAFVVIRSETCARAAATPAAPRAKILSPNTSPAIRTAVGASMYRFECVEIGHKPTNTAVNFGIIVLGAGNETTLAQQPRDIVFDRVYVHGDTGVGNKRCLAFNGARLAIINSWISECHGKGFDAQGVGGWNGPGPFLISGNRIEASGQAVMFGGADPVIPGLSPSDITITRNYIYKPLGWGRGRWSVKAAFELKHAKRVLFEGNVIVNHWADAQTGFAILLQTLSDNNTAWTWTTVADVTITNNVIRNSTGGVNLAGAVVYNGGILPTHPTSRVLISNNLFENVGRDPITNGAGISAQFLSGLVDVTFTRNTVTLAGSATKSLSLDGVPSTRSTISDNIFAAATYPMAGYQTSPGTKTLDTFMPGGVFLNNTLPGAVASQYRTGALGNAAGVDTAKLNAAITGVVR